MRRDVPAFDWNCFIHDLSSFVDEEMEEEENWLAIGEDVATPNTLVLLNLVFQHPLKCFYASNHYHHW